MSGREKEERGETVYVQTGGRGATGSEHVNLSMGYIMPLSSVYLALVVTDTAMCIFYVKPHCVTFHTINRIKY